MRSNPDTRLYPSPIRDLTRCPECGSPADITDRFVLESTDGPVEELKMRCVQRHWFVMPLSYLDGAG